jgi:hypothetical protein
MSARYRFGLFAVCALAVALLTGCITTIAPVRVLPSAPDANVADVRIAVQPNGIKHYVLKACAASCQLLYQRVQLAAPIYQHIFNGAELRSPALAVTDDGRAFVAFTECASTCIDRYSVIPADTPPTTIVIEELAAPGEISMGDPQLVARGNIVYASYYVAGDTYPALRYRQLSGGGSGGAIELRPTVDASGPSLAIGGDGTLHAAWKASSDSAIEIAYGSNSGSGGDFSPAASYDPRPNNSFREVDLALDPNDTPYIVYAYDDGGSDVVKIRCAAAAENCFSGVVDRTVSLDGAQNPWRLRDDPRIEVLGSSPAVVFAADTSATEKEEIWYYTPPSSGIDPGPVRVTSNTVRDGEPAIVVERSSYGPVPVVAWRAYETVTITQNGSSPSLDVDCPRDAFVFYFTSSTTRRVFASRGGCFTDPQDLAASGPWVAGVWLDRLSDEEHSRIVAWTLFNAHTSYAPVIVTQP